MAAIAESLSTLVQATTANSNSAAKVMENQELMMKQLALHFEQTNSLLSTQKHSSRSSSRHQGPPPPPPPPPTHGLTIRPPKLSLPSFDGSNPLDWLFQAYQYFTFYNIPPPQRLSMVSFRLTGDALSWYKYLHNNQLLTTWEDFTKCLETRFGPSSYDNHQASLFKLRQTSTVQCYVTDFERLSNCIIGLPSDALLNCFLYGLRKDILQELSILKPTSFQQAVGLAKLIEDKANDLRFRPKPAPPYHTPLMSTIPPSNIPTNSTLAILPTPTNQALPFTRLSPDALQKRRAAGLCFKCPEKFHPGHKCNPPQFLLIVDNEDYTDQPPLIDDDHHEPISDLEDKVNFEGGHDDTNRTVGSELARTTRTRKTPGRYLE